MTDQTETTPRAALSLTEGIAVVVGIVIGIGIFKTPSLIANNVDSEFAFIGVWALGGLVTLIGALCYAELAAAYPHSDPVWLGTRHGHSAGRDCSHRLRLG
jgi:amino acid transporter